jgi:diguanylate cyclase (GGDEF)-like protein
MATLLLIEESPRERAEVRELIEQAGLFSSILEAGDGLEGIKLLLSKRVDVVLSDLRMSNAGGEKVLDIRNSLPDGSHIPFVLLTGRRDYKNDAKLLGSGASDVILKPFHPDDLIARLGVQIKVMRLQRRLAKKLELLEHLSTTDPLTGLRNQAHLSEILAVEFERAERYEMPLSVVLGGVDIKRVAEARDREYADASLQGIAEVLRQSLRKSDVGGRYDADLFMAILSHTPLDGAEIFARRWKETVDEDWRPDVELRLGFASYGKQCGSPGELIEAVHRNLSKIEESA